MVFFLIAVSPPITCAKHTSHVASCFSSHHWEVPEWSHQLSYYPLLFACCSFRLHCGCLPFSDPVSAAWAVIHSLLSLLLFFSPLALSVTYFLPVPHHNRTPQPLVLVETPLLCAPRRSSTRSSTPPVLSWTLPTTALVTSWTSVPPTTAESQIRRVFPRWPTSTYKYALCMLVSVDLQDSPHCYNLWCHSHQHDASPSSQSEHGNPGLKLSRERIRTIK